MIVRGITQRGNVELKGRKHSNGGISGTGLYKPNLADLLWVGKTHYIPQQ